MWLAGAASLLASQKVGGESGDVNTLQEKQKKLKVRIFPQQHGILCVLAFCLTVPPTVYLSLQEVEKDLQTKREGISEAIRSVEELLADKGESLSPEERANLEVALTKMKEQYSALTDAVNTSLSEVHTAIDTTLQQNTQKVLKRF